MKQSYILAAIAAGVAFAWWRHMNPEKEPIPTTGASSTSAPVAPSGFPQVP